MPTFDLHVHIGGFNPKPAHITEAFTHAFEYTGAIVAPLIVIIAADKIGGGRPVSVFDGTEQMFSVTTDLMLRPP